MSRLSHTPSSHTAFTHRQDLDAAASPRHIKWHHPAWLLPPAVVSSGRVIYLYRNPKDTVVSWYHFQRLNPLYGVCVAPRSPMTVGSA